MEASEVKIFPITILLLIQSIPCITGDSRDCHTPHLPEFGRRLVGHVYKVISASIFVECLTACQMKNEESDKCQSMNFVLATRKCQLNSETKKSRPANFTHDPLSDYMTNPFRARKGSKIIVPGHSCKDIMDSGDSTGDGQYWINPFYQGNPFIVYCGMKEGGAVKNCGDVLKWGGNTSDVYTVDPDGLGPFKVFCDQKTSGGGWTVFQKRQDGSVDFFRGWADYNTGFGNLTGEFWLGLDKIYRLINQTRNRLRVELEDKTGNSAYAEYDYFAVSNEKDKYRLSLGTYSGTAGDSLSYHRGFPFTTKDQDNDDRGNGNCARMRDGAWWYNSCLRSNLNGLYKDGAHISIANGVNWEAWKGYRYSAKRAEMKIRPVRFPTQ